MHVDEFVFILSSVLFPPQYQSSSRTPGTDSLSASNFSKQVIYLHGLKWYITQLEANSNTLTNVFFFPASVITNYKPHLVVWPQKGQSLPTLGHTLNPRMGLRGTAPSMYPLCPCVCFRLSLCNHTQSDCIPSLKSL